MKLLLLLAPMFLCVSCALEKQYSSNPNYIDPSFAPGTSDPNHSTLNRFGKENDDPFQDTRWRPILSVPSDKRDAMHDYDWPYY